MFSDGGLIGDGGGNVGIWVDVPLEAEEGLFGDVEAESNVCEGVSIVGVGALGGEGGGNEVSVVLVSNNDGVWVDGSGVG